MHVAKEEDGDGAVEAVVVVVVVVEAAVVLGPAVEVAPAVADIAEPTTPAAAPAAQLFAHPTNSQVPYNAKEEESLPAHLHFPFLHYSNFHHLPSPHIHCHSSSTRSSSYVGQVVEDQQAYASLLQPAQKKPSLASRGSLVWYWY